MKIQSHRPLRGMCFETIFKKEKISSRRGKNPFESYLRTMTKIDSYDPRPSERDRLKKIRITNIRRLPSRGGFHVVGMGFVEGDVNKVKDLMRENGYTGARMGGIMIKL